MTRLVAARLALASWAISNPLIVPNNPMSGVCLSSLSARGAMFAMRKRSRERHGHCSQKPHNDGPHMLSLELKTSPINATRLDPAVQCHDMSHGQNYAARSRREPRPTGPARRHGWAESPHELPISSIGGSTCCNTDHILQSRDNLHSLNRSSGIAR